MKANRSGNCRGKACFAGNLMGVVLGIAALLVTGDARAQFGPYTTDANTVTLFHFDGTAVVDNDLMQADSSGNGYNLTDNGMTPLSSSANSSLLKAWDESGSTFGTAANGYNPATYVGSGTDWTIETLLNIRDFDGAVPGERRDFLRFDSGTSMGYRGDGFFEMIVDGNSQFSTASQVQTGVWFQIAITYEASTGTMKLYQNGTDITGGAGAIPINEPLSGVFRLGRAAGNIHNWMDEVRVSDTIRTFAPFNPNVEPIPEPSTFALLVVSAAVVSRRMKQYLSR